jgi:DNA-binding transcriptional LysR family regulator
MVSHQRHPIARPRLAELRQHRFILFRKGSRMQEPIDRWFAAHNFEPNVIMRFDNAEFIRSMVRSGMGLSLLPFWVVHRDIKEHRLTMIRPAESPLHSKIALVRRKSAFVPRPVQAFIESARTLDARHLRLLVSHPASGQPSGLGNEPGTPQPRMARGQSSFTSR